MKKLILVGYSSFGEIAYQYFSHDSDYTVVSFSAEKDYMDKESMYGFPIVPFEDLEKEFDPNTHDIFVSVIYRGMNDVRTRLYKEAKEKGFGIASYISSRAFVWWNVVLGEHNFIFEDNTIQPFVSMGDNNILWSGNHIGHHTIIGNNNFISSHVVISGHCKISDNTFFGVNSTVGNDLEIASYSLVGQHASVVKHIASPGKIFIGSPAKPIEGKESREAL
jgi:sugar O-acyltransferase (sialic acid O-acetyltransferase NeuD family)